MIKCSNLHDFLGATNVHYLPKTYSPSNRLPILSVLESSLDPKIEPRQPHDCLRELVTESHIARTTFDRNILPLLIDILSSRKPVTGPEKVPERVEDKIAGKLKIDQSRIADYKSSGKIHYGWNCDFTRSMQPVGTMKFIERATNIFQGRGIITISKGNNTDPVNIVILDVENGFVKEEAHKPNLMRINLKLAIPIKLNDGTETFHVLEHKILLKASVQNEKEGCAAWAEYRSLEKLENELVAAFDKAISDSPEAIDLEKKFNQATISKEKSNIRRREINARDHVIHGIHNLVGYKPEGKEGSVRGISWVFTPMEEVVSQLKTEKNADRLMKPRMQKEFT